MDLDALLQQLNYQRAWIDVKLQNLEHGAMLTSPELDQFQVQQKALEMAFLKDFPVLGKRFFRKLKKLLGKNTLIVNSDFGVQKPGELPKPKFGSLKKSIQNKRKSTPLRSVQQLEHFIRAHPAADRLRTKDGKYEAPNFTKETVEELLGHQVSCMTLDKVQKRLDLAPKNIKRRKRKSTKRQGRYL